MTQGKDEALYPNGNDGDSTEEIKRREEARARQMSGLRPRWKPGQSGNPGGRREMPPEVRKALEAGSEDAAKRLVSLIKSPDERIALLASQALLDRLYGKAAQAVDKTVTTTTVQAQHLNILMELQARRDEALKAVEVIEGHTDKVVEYDPPKPNE